MKVGIAWEELNPEKLEELNSEKLYIERYMDDTPKCSSNKPTLVCTFWLAKSFSSAVSSSVVSHWLRPVMYRSGSEKQNLSKQEQIVVAFPHE